MKPVALALSLAGASLGGLFLAGCDSPPGSVTEDGEGMESGLPARYQVTHTHSIRDGDRIEIEGDGELTYVDVHTPGGIGSAQIDLVEGEWPRQVVLRINTTMLEHFSLSRSGNELAFDGGFHHRLDPKSGEYQHQAHHDDSLEVVVVEVDGKPLHFEIVVPAALLADRPQWFAISWIDAYRS